MISFLKLSDIQADQRAQPRVVVSAEKIAEYVEDMQRGDKFPPLIVFHDGAMYWLADGFHRYFAARAADLTKFKCDVREGGLRDAIWYSCGANASHGLRRTNDDKRRAVAKLLTDEWPGLTDSEIARQCCVTHPFVGKVRKEIESLSLETVSSDKRTFTTKHGTTSTMNVSNIGPKPADFGYLAKSLNDIDRAIEMLKEPDEAVANFPTDQWYLFPLSKLESMAAWMAAFAAAWRRKMEAQADERISAAAATGDRPQL